jgi:hypothetical protein
MAPFANRALSLVIFGYISATNGAGQLPAKPGPAPAGAVARPTWP